MNRSKFVAIIFAAALAALAVTGKKLYSRLKRVWQANKDDFFITATIKDKSQTQHSGEIRFRGMVFKYPIPKDGLEHQVRIEYVSGNARIFIDGVMLSHK